MEAVHSPRRQAHETAKGARAETMTMRTTKKRQLSLGILALSLTTTAALLVTASPAGAQTTTTTETTRTQLTTTLPGCTENVNLAFDQTHKTQTQNGPNVVSVSDTFHEQGTGTGVSSTAQYQFSSMSTNRFRSTSQNFYTRIVIREHLIRQGASVPGDDQFIVLTMLTNVTNGHAVFKNEGIQIDCR
jgi:hypothetical protein